MLTRLEWYLYWFVCVVFFTAIVSSYPITESYPSSSWIIFTIVIYSFIFAYLLVNNLQQIFFAIQTIYAFATLAVCEEIFTPVKQKIFTQGILFVVLLWLLFTEIVCQALLTSAVSTFAITVYYEVSIWLQMLFLLYAYHPRQFSIYFYLYPDERYFATTAANTRNNEDVLVEDTTR